MNPYEDVPKVRVVATYLEEDDGPIFEFFMSVMNYLNVSLTVAAAWMIALNLFDQLTRYI